MPRLAAPLTVLLLLLAGCQASPAPSPAPSPAHPPLQLAGTSWTVTHIDTKATVASATPTIDFHPGPSAAPETPAAAGADAPITTNLSANGGCNYMSGVFTQSGASLTVSNLGTTLMLCGDDAVNAQESAFMAALGASATFTGDASGIVISDTSGAERLRLASDPTPTPEPAPKPLMGTQWNLSSFFENEAASPLVKGTSITMTIDNGTLHAKACNAINGPVTIDGMSFKAGTLASTRMACPGDQDTQETRFLDILTTATTISVQGDSLTLVAPDGRALVFVAQP